MPKLDAYTAVSIAEGWGGNEDATEEEQLEAWQYLHNTGLAYELQGWFGRMARALLAEGLIMNSPSGAERERQAIARAEHGRAINARREANTAW